MFFYLKNGTNFLFIKLFIRYVNDKQIIIIRALCQIWKIITKSSKNILNVSNNQILLMCG